jgi:hypothetical protein
MRDTDRSFIAGFLDADGSIYVRLKPNSDYRYDFQIVPVIVFFQKKEKVLILEHIKDLLNVGYLRFRRDGIVEYTIGDHKGLRKIINVVLKYAVLKKEQLILMEAILSYKGSVKTANDFLILAKMIDKFEDLNYSKKRSVKSQQVKSRLIDKGLL